MDHLLCTQAFIASLCFETSLFQKVYPLWSPPYPNLFILDKVKSWGMLKSIIKQLIKTFAPMALTPTSSETICKIQAFYSLDLSSIGLDSLMEF